MRCLRSLRGLSSLGHLNRLLRGWCASTVVAQELANRCRGLRSVRDALRRWTLRYWLSLLAGLCLLSRLRLLTCHCLCRC